MKIRYPLDPNGNSNLKFKVDGDIYKHRARLVPKGYSQKEGIDYVESFAFVANLNTIRLMNALATKNKWKVHQLDVCLLEWGTKTRSIPCSAKKSC